MDFQIYIGWDSRSRAAWRVCAASLQAHAGEPVAVSGIGREQLERTGYYRRETRLVEGRLYDVPSGEYCSTAFSLARFWVPIVAGATGWALYCDSDFLWRADVRGILEYADPGKAVMVVPHAHEPSEAVKMNAQAQSAYFRKNWSSLILWNLNHAGCRRLGLHDLNAWHKHDLHGFRWLADNEIGFLPSCWNHLIGVPARDERDGRDDRDDVKAAHFTLGTPDMPGYEHSEFAPEWFSYLTPSRSSRRHAVTGVACDPAN